MAKAATQRSEPTPLSGRLPEEIVIWEILVRLPPKNLVRCRAVCRAWRRITSTRHFLLAHHGHQPSLPLLSGSEYGVDCHQDIIAFDHRAATAQIQPLARLIDPNLRAVGSCDGLLVMSIDEYDRTHFFVCNPVTRQWGDLPILRGFHFSGIYPHRPTGQYRLLLYRSQICKVMYEGKVPGDKDSWYVLTLGCDEVPRCIGWPEVEAQHGTPVLVRGSLHWYPAKHQTRSKMILAFDTTSESFRLMRAPVLPESAYRFETHGSYLFEMDGMLAMYMHNDAVQLLISGCCTTTRVRSGPSSTGLNCWLRSSWQDLNDLDVGMWWLHLRVMMCSCWSILISGCFTSTGRAGWLPVAVMIAKASIFLCISSNKALFSIPSFRLYRIMK